MNRIIIGNDKNITIVEDSLIEISSLSNIYINIKVEKDCVIYLKTDNLSGTFNMNFDVFDNVVIKRLTSNDNVDELVTFNLNSSYKKLEYNMFGYNVLENKFKVVLNHLNNNIESFVKINLVNKYEGDVVIDINSYTGFGIINCVSDQVSNVINLDNSKCRISPNMYIASKDIIATHTAFIGNVRKEDLFYLMSKSLDKDFAKELLITSFVWEYLREDEKKYFV